ncbi:MAG: hypothetical protein RLZZ416_107 [Candidatus Parcubacteria bacterium]|jgi:hypothetical protein
MDEVLRDLAHVESSGEQQTLRDYPIEGEVTAEQLRQLAELDVEIAITEERGRLVLSITEEGGIGDDQAHERMIHSRVSVHTHPEESGVIFDAPSYSDIISALERRGEPSPMFIVHPKGITVCKPAPEAVQEQRPYVMRAGSGKQDAAEAAKEQREYADRVGAIASEALWTETEEIEEILRIINMRS